MAGVGGTPQEWEEGLGQREGLRGQPSERSVRFPKSRGTSDFPELGVNKGSGCLQVGRAQGDCWECRAGVILGILHPEQRPEGWEERRASGERHPPPQLGACQALSPQSVSTGQTPLGGPGVSSRDHTGTTESPTRGLLEALSGAGGSLQALLSEGGGDLPGRKRRERPPSRRRGAGGERQMGRQAGVPTWGEEAASSRHFFSLP